MSALDKAFIDGFIKAAENQISNLETNLVEPGMPGAWTGPTNSPVTSALMSGAVGMGAGMTGGALADKNIWRTGVNTGVGSSIGYLLANLLARNKAPGQQDVYSTLGGLLGGGVGLGAGLLAKHKKKDSLLNVTVPGGLTLSAKTAGAQDVMNKTLGQLPNIRGYDSLAGGVIGGTGGWLYNKLMKNKEDTKQQARHKLLDRVVGGAGLGALGANLVGDRTRRYLSNKINLYGYEPKDVKPKNFKEIWDGAILDKPLEGQSKSPNMDNQARRALMREGMGVEPYNAKDNIWAKQQDGSFSINPENNNSGDLVKNMMFGYNNNRFTESPDTYKGLLADPVKFIGNNINSSPTGSQHLLMDPLIGSERTSLYPYKSKYEEPDYLAKILKRWDVRLKNPEKEALKQYLLNKFVHKDPNPSAYSGSEYMGNLDFKANDPYDVPKDMKNVLKTDVEREVAQNLIYKNSPWVSQRLFMKKMPGEASGYTAVPATSSGQFYGDTTALQYTADPVNPAKFVSPESVLNQ